MPDPYSSFGEGFQGGVNMAAGLVTAKAKSDENAREKVKLKFDELRKNLQTHSEVLKSDAPMKLREAAANGILNMYRQNAKDLGIDPSAVPQNITFNEDFAKEFSNKVLSMNKLYEKGIIGRNDYRVGMFELSQGYKNATGKDNPDIMKVGEDVASKDAKTITATIGDKKVMLQETSPGSGQFAPMKTSEGVSIEGPAVQRVEMVKPPSETERTAIAQTRADIELYDSMLDRVKNNPNWVGVGKDMAASVGATMNLLSPEHNQFVSDVKLNKLKDYKFFLGTAQSKREAQNAIKAIPDIGMPDKQFTGAVQATKANKERMLSRTLEVLRQSGIQVPEGTGQDQVLRTYLQAKAAGKLKPVSGTPKAGAGSPSLMMLLQEAEKESE